ncbi:peroxiredoxin [bacterium]|nr:peroxiredoxin [bacterium]
MWWLDVLYSPDSENSAGQAPAMLDTGDRAPAATLTAHDGGRVSLADFHGKQPVVLFYYPRANTSGCTKETAAFAERYGEFALTGTAVFGVSSDKPAANAKFAEKLKLPFKLLTDEGLQLWHDFGVRLGGGKSIKRITFVLDKEGYIVLVYYYSGRGDVTSHVEESLKAVQALVSK